jgi:hypothetical protein
LRQSAGGAAKDSMEETMTTKTCALIVGATSGIGRRIAHVLHSSLDGVTPDQAYFNSLPLRLAA